jgi:hypothetical protein
MSRQPDDGVRPMSVPPDHDPDAAQPEPPGDDVGELEDAPDPVDPLKRGDDQDQPGADPTPPPIPPG